jgi:hypothetical protein
VLYLWSGDKFCYKEENRIKNPETQKEFLALKLSGIKIPDPSTL